MVLERLIPDETNVQSIAYNMDVDAYLIVLFLPSVHNVAAKHS